MSETPAVMHLVHNLEVGGTQRVILDLAEGMQQGRRYRPVVCAWRRGGPIEAALARAGVAATALTLPRRPVWLGPLFVRDALRVVRAIEDVARHHRVRLIHSHMSDSAFWGALVARRLGCPVVVTGHSNNPIPDGLRHRVVRGALERWALRWAARRADCVIGVSSSVKDALCRVTGVAPARVVVVTNGIRLPAARPPSDRTAIRRQLGLDPKARVLVCVGRLVPSKAHAALLAMMPDVLARHPSARLLLVGDGALRGPLEAEAERLGVARAVVFAGERADVAAILDASDLFVSASLLEGISLAVLEAMAAGVPVVACASPGNDEVLADGAGLAVATNDAPALAAAVDRVLSDAVLARRLASEGRRRVAARYTVDRVVAQVTRIYDELLGDSPRHLAAGGIP